MKWGWSASGWKSNRGTTAAKELLDLSMLVLAKAGWDTFTNKRQEGIRMFRAPGIMSVETSFPDATPAFSVSSTNKNFPWSTLLSTPFWSCTHRPGSADEARQMWLLRLRVHRSPHTGDRGILSRQENLYNCREDRRTCRREKTGRDILVGKSPWHPHRRGRRARYCQGNAPQYGGEILLESAQIANRKFHSSLGEITTYSNMKSTRVFCAWPSWPKQHKMKIWWGVSEGKYGYRVDTKAWLTCISADRRSDLKSERHLYLECAV